MKTREESGQATIEMVIMIAVFLGFAFTIQKAFRENEYFANLVTTPWLATAGLIQNGAWGKPAATMYMHPNNFDRVSTVRGDVLK